MPPSDATLLVEAHEERMQRLESGYSDIAVQVAAFSEKQEHLDQKLDETRTYLGEKIDGACSAIADLTAHVSTSADRLQHLEGWKKKSDDRLKWFKHFLRAAAIATVAESGHQIWNFLHRLH